MKRVLFLLWFCLWCIVAFSAVEEEEKLPPKVEISVLYEDRTVVDSAMVKLYDKDRRLLGEYLFTQGTTLFGMMMITDTAVVTYYGKYFMEVSKPGYKTTEVECDVTGESIRYAPIAFMVPDGSSGEGGGAWLAVAVVVVAGGAWWFARRKKRLTINDE